MKLHYILIALILVMNLVSAEVQSLPTQKQNTCVVMAQTCSNCTYVNLTSVKYPNSTFRTIGEYMTSSGYNYNYSFCDTSALGTYLATTCGDVDGDNTCVDYDFEVTPSGSKNVDSGGGMILFGSLLTVLIISVISLIYGSKVENVAAKVFFISLGCIALLISFLYTMVMISQYMATNPNFVSGYETFVFVLKTLATIGIIALIIILILVFIKSWKIKRGFYD